MPAGTQQIRFSARNPVEPLAGTWEVMRPPNPDAFVVPPPPENQSPATDAELAELRVLALGRTPQDTRQILRWSTYEPSLATNWETLASHLGDSAGLSPPAAARVHHLLTTAIYTALIACWDAKYRYMRPRPSQLDPGVNPNVIPVPEHPSYPSGHSTVSGAASTIISRLFPAAMAVADALAQDSGISRLKAGIHYRSDHTAGLRLGRQVAEAVLNEMRARDRGPLVHLPRSDVAPLTYQELIGILDCQQLACRPRPTVR